MPQKDLSPTKSSKSATPKPSAPATGMATPVQFVKGVGPRLGSVLRSREIETVKDLVYFFPRAYQDRTHFAEAANLEDGVIATLRVNVLSQRRIPTQRGKSILEVRCSDGTSPLSLKWFHTPYGLEKKLLPGAQIVATGKVKHFQGRPEIVHPEISFGVGAATPTPLLQVRDGANAPLETSETSQDDPNVGRIIPVYIEIEGVPSRTLRKVLWEALDKYGLFLEEDLPLYLLKRHGLPVIGQAVRALHFPPDDLVSSIQDLVEFKTPAHRRLIYGEFFKFEFLMLRKRLQIESVGAPPFTSYQRDTPEQAERSSRWNALLNKLPFELTRGQQQAIQEILEDFNQPYPMSRLVQGDVGSGKTIVALLAAAWISERGGQSVLMAPTEILAEQHLKSAQRIFGDSLKVALLTGKSTTAERNQLQKRLSSGEPLLLIGTHAVIEDAVVFSNLALVMIDEQHRFGVEQRRLLRRKGLKKDETGTKLILPHSLILTATPIPRTLALTAFGDLSVTTIRELPKGRSPIFTRVVRNYADRNRAYEKIREELQSGRQAYFIYPLINESEAEGFTELKNAVAEAETLANEVFPEFRVGLLHGEMRPEEKAKVMAEFKEGKVKVLVSTTVVEVGVDVPNATVMVIEHAERFGLSQLHQLRGRVGRAQWQSYCFLFAQQRSSSVTAQRLEVLEETHDGFLIAEADLKIRGPGEFLGTRQAGGLAFLIADLVRDQEWVFKAREDVIEMMKKDPELKTEEHRTLRRYLEREGLIQSDRLQTA